LTAPAARSYAEDRERRVEIGTEIVSLSSVSSDGDRLTVFGLPSATVFNRPMVYSSFAVSDRLALEPQLGFVSVSGGDSSAHTLSFGAQLDGFFAGHQRPSPYVFARAFLVNTKYDGDNNSNSSTQPAVGG